MRLATALTAAAALAAAAAPASAASSSGGGPLIYTTQNSHAITIGSVTGKGGRLIFGSTAVVDALRWSPNHRRFAFTAAQGKTVQVRVASSNGRHIVRLHQERGNTIGDLAWSRDSSRIAFAVSGSAGSPGVWAVTVHSRHAKRLGSGSCTQPSFSPTGVRVAMVCGDATAARIEVANVRTGESRVVWGEPGRRPEGLSWTRDGRGLIFGRTAVSATLPVDGAQPAPPVTEMRELDLGSGIDRAFVPLTGFSQGAPLASPDRHRVAWVQYATPDAPELWVAHSDGSGAHRLAAATKAPTAILWSPDSKLLLVPGLRTHGWSLVDAASGKVRSAPGPRVAYAWDW